MTNDGLFSMPKPRVVPGGTRRMDRKMPETSVTYMNMHISHCGQAKRLTLAKDQGIKVELDLDAKPPSTVR